MNLDKITQNYLDIFPTDFSENPMQRKISDYLICKIYPAKFHQYQLIYFNEKLSEEIGLGRFQKDNLDFLVGQNLPHTIQPFATAYAGHQFGNWAGQLGDGRAIYAGELNFDEKSTEIQWKGAGATPFSRAGDGRAVLRSSVREFLMSEAIYHLGIPTTRALSICTTGEMVERDILYNGNPKKEPGAVVVRTAESFLRFGHFEWLSAQKKYGLLQQLLDFTIENYFPEINKTSETKYKDYFREISKKTAELIVHWQRVGFVHGVMNTDNMSSIGITIDYGPFGMLEEYNPNFTPNTTDLPGRRYTFDNQPAIAQWNLWRLANALFPLINDEDFLSQELEEFNHYYQKTYTEMMMEKLGFPNHTKVDNELVGNCLAVMEKLALDYTLFFSHLETWLPTDDILQHFEPCIYTQKSKEEIKILEKFLAQYQKNLTQNNISNDDRKKIMTSVNPKFVLRNYLLYECIEEVTEWKMEKFHQLLSALQNPYSSPESNLTQKRPIQYNNQPGCSMLSCSS